MNNTPKWMLWTGRVVSVLVALMLIMSGIMKLVQPPQFVDEFSKFGYPAPSATGIGIVELVCTVLYLIPRTSVLGAILLTGYLGGATATHVRVSDSFIAPVIVGMIVWSGLWLRDERIRRLIPLCCCPAQPSTKEHN